LDIPFHLVSTVNSATLHVVVVQPLNCEVPCSHIGDPHICVAFQYSVSKIICWSICGRRWVIFTV
jgi:hypothetical protein